MKVNDCCAMAIAGVELIGLQNNAQQQIDRLMILLKQKNN